MATPPTPNLGPRMIPAEYAETIGHICVLWNMVEDATAYLLGYYFKLGHEPANALFGVLGNRSRIDLLRYISGKREKNPQILDRVEHLCKCYDICRENRNIVAHSSVRLSGPSQVEDVIKRSNSSLGKFVSYGYNLEQIDKVRRDIEATLFFATRLFATIAVNELERGQSWAAPEPLPLPDKFPQPDKLNSIPRAYQDERPPPPPSEE